ncbi:MAG TPA: carboxylesterase family protein [Caulobacteraceae bacterium]|nr:carboxylesterase family protein [Caulobacteraceae bacterium]
MTGILQGEGADRRAVLGGAAALAAAVAAGGALGSPLAGGATAAPLAETAYGAVSGELQDGINVFRGIPYGAPTGGGDRFMPAEPPRPWGGVRRATRFGDQCPQLPPPPITAWASWALATGESEDCLVLNVCTPGLADGKKRPVMVWMHGGGYSMLNGSSPVYDGVKLCRRGDVVLVTLNHRLNLFGYLYLAELGGPRFADSGNIGQLDLIAALQWVKQNIAAFGGDPDRVMIFGESGGGGKVSTLMAMPAARGLFHRAAIQSGPGLTAIAPAAATALARKVCAAVGVSARSPGDLQHVSVERLREALKTVSKDDATGFGPVLDAKNLPRDPFTPDAPAVSADVPVIVGYNATETTIFSPRSAFDLDWPGLERALAAQARGAHVGKLIAAFRQLQPAASPSDLYFEITTDVWMGRGSIALAERKAALGAAGAYLYRLDFETPVDRLRSPHSLDLPLVFDTVDKSASLLGASAPRAQKVADQMSAAWIAFAYTGSPNATGLASWPRYDPQARSTMIFNVTSRAVNDPDSAERELIAAVPPQLAA